MNQEYDAQLMALLEGIWGEGFMSPGGTDEVDRYLDGVDLAGCRVLDIGCGLGGIDIHLLRRHAAAHVTGIDVEANLIERSVGLAEKYGLAERAEFICVEPGPLPFTERSFDIVEAVQVEAEAIGASAVALSLAWVLAQPNLTSAIIGPRTVEQLEGNLAALAVEADEELLERLDAACEPYESYLDFMQSGVFAQRIADVE